jgi:penicillin-binding protein 1A
MMEILLTKKKLIILIAVLLPVIGFLLLFISALSKMQSKQDLINYNNAVASVVLSDEHELIGKIFTENRTNIAYEEIPTHLIEALLATEDIRFYRHNGVDTKSLIRVFFKTILLSKKTAGGGSTLSQQLVKNLFGRNIKGPFAIVVIKTREVFMARRIEKVFTKDEILTLYLNTVPFGENVYGIDAAAQRYFNKKASTLTLEEGAVLVGMLKANSLYNPRLNPKNSISRRNLVLRQMARYKFLTKVEADSISRIPLKLNYSNLESEGFADYFIYQIKKSAQQILNNGASASGVKYNLEEDGLVIYTSLDLRLQKAVNKAFYDHLSVMQKKLEAQYSRRGGKRVLDDLVKSELEHQHLSDRANETDVRQIFTWNGTVTDSITIADSIRHNILLLHAATVAIDPQSGAIKAWAGGIDFKTQPYDQILARRQTGSTFKPVLFAAAFEQGIRPCDYLDNDSITIKGYEDWKPQNFDLTFGGKYSLAGALAKSMNIPTLNLFFRLGFGTVDSLWRRMGFSFVLDNTPALAMGTAEASALELAVAYAAFSNGGFRINPYMIESITDHNGEVIWKREESFSRQRIISESTAQLLNTVLLKAVNEGTGYPLRSTYGINIPVAGKTGTTQDYSDAWFASYNPALVLISRVGASVPSIHFNSGANGTGSALALPLAGHTYIAIQRNTQLRKKYSTAFPQLPPELEAEFLCADYKEEDVLDNFFDLFQRDRIRYDTLDDKSARKRRSIFRRIFGL